MFAMHRLPRLALLMLAGAALALSGAGSSLRAAGAQDARIDVLILFTSSPDASDHAQVRGLGGQVKHTYHLVPAIAASVPEAVVTALHNNPRVVAVEPDGEVFAIGQDVDDELDNTWGVKRIGGGTAHSQGHTGAGIRVAVIDTGIDYTHPDLAGRYDPSCSNDFVNGDADPFDDNSHGTHVAGTIAAIRDGYGVVGVAPDVTICALKILDSQGSGSFSNVILALQRAVDDGVAVTNNSYGSSGSPGTTVQAAFDNAYAAGVLHVAAAGNTGNCAGIGDNVGYPARYASVIAVTATNASDARPCFSSTGSNAELAAPGVSINSTIPDGYALYSGTSMASPHVAGVAALLFGAGGVTNDDVRAILDSTAQDLGAAGRDKLYGYGLVDAVAALAAVGGPPPPPATGGTAAVASIGYSTSGGRGGTKDLLITVTIVDDGAAPVSGVGVSVSVQRNGGAYGSGTGTTGTGGAVAFKINNAPAGTYVTTVTNVSATGLTWDGSTPPNSFTK